MKFVPEPPQKIMIEKILSQDVVFAIVGMGVGKSSSVLSAFCQLQKESKVEAMLVIAPVRVCNLTWPMEVQQWDQFKHLKVANLRTPLGRRAFIAGQGQVYVCNYEAIPMLVKLVEKRGGTVPYQMVVYDESTRAKNPTSKRINLLRKEIPQVRRRVNLTGTPAPNSLLDLFAQVRLLDDGQRLGRSFDHFKRTYFAATDYQQYNWEPIPGAAERIDERIADITLTLRTSDWVKDLPDCYVNDVEVKLPPAVMAQYEEFKKELILELRREVQITAANAAVLVRKLLQFTSGAIYDGEKKAHEVHDYKTEALAKLIKETKGPVLVLCDFKHEQDRIRRKFPQARFFADARTPMLQMQLITQWNRREIPILVGHPMSMGHGLNLQQGSKTMVWMSLTYSRESYEQTIARLHRRGQKEVVTVHRLMVPGTVDDVVAEVLEEKRNTEQRLLTALMLLEGDHKGRTPLKFASEPETEFDEESFWG
jgi:SNF2 family DNA or RNA helicase